jgi:hypothetical protein
VHAIRRKLRNFLTVKSYVKISASRARNMELQPHRGETLAGQGAICHSLGSISRTPHRHASVCASYASFRTSMNARAS